MLGIQRGGSVERCGELKLECEDGARRRLAGVRTGPYIHLTRIALPGAWSLFNNSIPERQSSSALLAGRRTNAWNGTMCQSRNFCRSSHH